MAGVSILAMRNWASLVTNKQLFRTLLFCYLGLFVVILLIGIWCVAATILTFQPVQFYKISPAVTPFPYYVCTLVFCIPYLLVIVYYLLDLHYFIGEMDAKGDIKEPGRRPKGTVDLAGVTLWNTFGLFCCAIPFMVLFQIGVVLEMVWRFICCREEDEDEGGGKRRKRGLCYRISKTIRNRCCWCCCPMPPSPVSTEVLDELRRLEEEEQERLRARERLAREALEREMQVRRALLRPLSILI